VNPKRRPRTEAIDWPSIRQRLERAIRATEEALLLSPLRAREVMVERARALARVPAEAAGAGEVLEVVVFALAGERYALATRLVREVVRLTDFTPLPGAPDFVVGVTNLRGHILAIFDLRKFFGLALRGLTDQTRLLVLGEERAEFGILADTAYEVTTLRTYAIHPPPGSVAGVAREYLLGVTAEALVVLDGAVLLQDRRLFIDQGEESGV
jgi:purine-binding chemotaxis protein CheW